METLSHQYFGLDPNEKKLQSLLSEPSCSSGSIIELKSWSSLSIFKVSNRLKEHVL